MNKIFNNIKKEYTWRTMYMHPTEYLLNIDFALFLVYEISLCEKNPHKLIYDGFENYYGLYELDGVVESGDFISCVRYDAKNERPFICLHPLFNYLPDAVKKFTLYHEAGHIAMGNIFTTDKDRMKYEMERLEFILKGDVHPYEILADTYASERMSKNEILEFSKFTFEHSPHYTDLSLRAKLLSKNL